MRVPVVALTHASLLVALAAAAAACLPASNPYDPDAPAAAQQPAQVRGAVHDADGPVVDVAIAIDRAGAVVTVQTDDAGRYTLEGVVPGPSILSVADSGYEPFARSLVLIAGESRVEDVLLVERAGRMRGVARKSAALDDGLAADHSGVVVEVLGENKLTSTNAAGAWTIDIGPGTYELQLTAPEHNALAVGGVVVSGEADTIVDTVTLAANPGTLTGAVTLEPLVPGGETHGGVTVTVAGSSVTTGSDDTFLLTELAAGATVVRFSRPEYQDAERIAVIKAGNEVVLPAVRLARASGAVAGVVDLGSGFSDHSGVTIALRGAAGTFAGVSASDGSFVIGSVPSGIYDVEGTRAGFIPGDGGAVSVLPDQTVVIGAPIQLSAQTGDFLINGGQVFTNDRDVAVTLAPGATDNLAQMRVSQDPSFLNVAPIPFAADFGFTLGGGEGENAIFLELIDDQGAVTGPFQSAIILDTVAPAPVSFTINGGAGFSNNIDGIVVLSLAASDATSGIEQMQLSLDDSFDEPFRDFSANLVFNLPNADQLHTVRVRYQDRAGNVTAAADAGSASITLDRVRPVIALVEIEGGDAFAALPFVSLTVTPAPGSEDTVAMALSTDPLFPVELFQPLASPSTFALAPGQGTRTASVKLKDAAGNISTAVTDDIVVDTTAPGAASVVVAGGAAVTNQPLVSVALAAQDAARARVSLSGAFDPDGADFAADFDVTVDLGADGDGDKTVFAQFVDDAGNLSAVVSARITLDRQAPLPGDTPVLINSGDAFAASVSVNVTFDVADAVAVAVATDGAVDGESFQPFSQVLTVLLPALPCAAGNLGCRTVCAVFKDGASNTLGPLCDAITLDTSEPSAPLIVEDDSVVNDSNFLLHLVSSPSDEFFSHFEALIDPVQPEFLLLTPSAPVDGQLTVALALLAPSSSDPALAAEPNLIRVRAVDLAGNVSPESAITVIVDDVPPAAPLLAGLPSPINADTVSVNFLTQNPADDDATFDHYLVDTSLLPEAFATSLRDGIVVTLLPNVANTITVTAVDAAGNVSLPATGLVREDSIAPVAPSVTPLAATVRADRVEIGLVAPAIDDVSGAAQVRYEVKDGFGQGFQGVSGQGPFFAALRPSRDNQICVRGRDQAGNVSIEDCAAITEAENREVLGSIDQPRSHDLFGDLLAYTSGGRVLLRDLSEGIDELVLAEASSSFSAGGDIFIDGSARRAILVWDSNGSRTAIAEVSFNPIAGAPPTVSVGLFEGTGATVNGNDVVYFRAGLGVRRRGVAVPADLVAGGQFDVDPADNGIAVSPSTVSLCPETRVRSAGGAVVWCEGGGALLRAVLPAGAPELITADLAAPLVGSLGDSPTPGASQQPLIDDDRMVWAEGPERRLTILELTDGPDTAPAQKVVTDLVVDDLQDLSGGHAVDVRVRADLLLNDIFVIDVRTPDDPSERPLTNDLPPQGEPSIDGARVTFKDNARGETVQLVELSDTRWIFASPELSFEAVTSTQVSAWLETANNVIQLAARRLPAESNAVTRADEAAFPVFFAGPSRLDPPYAAGGTRVAYLSGSGVPFRLRVRDLATNAIATVATDAAAAFALDPDGDALVYVDASNALKRVALGALTGPFAATTLPLAGAGAIIMVDVDDSMVVAQRGGDVDRDTGASGAGAVACSQGASSGVLAGLSVRGPKVARSSGSGGFLFAGAADGTDVRVCTLTCGAVPACTGVVDAGPGVGDDSHVQIARDGRVAYLNDAQILPQVVLFDIADARRVVLTAPDFERSGISLAEGRVTWSDPSLGTFDVFELTLP